MINWLHLLWILPVTFFLGFLCAAMLSAGKAADEQAVRWWDERLPYHREWEDGKHDV